MKYWAFSFNIATHFYSVIDYFLRKISVRVHNTDWCEIPSPKSFWTILIFNHIEILLLLLLSCHIELAHIIAFIQQSDQMPMKCTMNAFFGALIKKKKTRKFWWNIFGNTFFSICSKREKNNISRWPCTLH